MILEVKITNYGDNIIKINVNEESFEKMTTIERNVLIDTHIREFLMQNFTKEEILNFNKPFCSYNIIGNKKPVSKYVISDVII